MPSLSAPLWYGYGEYLRRRFGFRVRKISVDAGFSCPNRDGTCGRGGCVYCVNESFSPRSADRGLDVGEQIARGIEAANRRDAAGGVLAYFQSYSNTYAPVERLRALWDEALAVDGVVGLSVATRPDCVDDTVRDLLAEFAERGYVQLELGLQSACDETLEAVGRGHTVEDFVACAARCRGHGFDMCAHMIVGLPGEGRDEALNTARLAVDAGMDGLKIHNLHLVRGSALADPRCRLPVRILELEEYAPIVADILECLPPSMVVQRLWGSAPREMLLAPLWCLDGNAARAAIESELRRRGSRQGAGVA